MRGEKTGGTFDYISMEDHAFSLSLEKTSKKVSSPALLIAIQTKSIPAKNRESKTKDEKWEEAINAVIADKGMRVTTS